VSLAGEPMLLRAGRAAAQAGTVGALVAAVPADLVEGARVLLAELSVPVTVVAGRETRQGSARAALEAAGDVETVVVHDAARCLSPPDLFDRCVQALTPGVDGAVACAPVTDTPKRAEDGLVTQTLDRTGLWAAQTPQAFRSAVYRRAHEAAESCSYEATDDAALVERIGARVVVVSAPSWNLKVTTPEDIGVAEALLATRSVESGRSG